PTVTTVGMKFIPLQASKFSARPETLSHVLASHQLAPGNVLAPPGSRCTRGSKKWAGASPADVPAPRTKRVPGPHVRQWSWVLEAVASSCSAREARRYR